MNLGNFKLHDPGKDADDPVTPRGDARFRKPLKAGAELNELWGWAPGYTKVDPALGEFSRPEEWTLNGNGPAAAL